MASDKMRGFYIISKKDRNAVPPLLDQHSRDALTLVLVL